MSSLILSNISQSDVDMLEEQCCEMQKWYEEEKQLQAQLEEATEARHVEHVAQKARKIAKAKVRKEAKKQKLVDEKKKRKWMEYFQ